MNNHNNHSTMFFTDCSLEAVVYRLAEATAMHPLRSDATQQDVFNTPQERRDQIIYHLNKTIEVKSHADLAIRFAKQLLDEPDFASRSFFEPDVY